MNIVTRDFGEIEIDESTILTMPEGIIGFEDTKRYALISPLGDGVFPMWFQSVEAPEPFELLRMPLREWHKYLFS